MGRVSVQSPTSSLDELAANKLANSSNNDLSKSDSLSGCYIKKSKRDPIVEYDTELAESIEYELGLKKQNGPRYAFIFITFIYFE